jgi:hypothetical protein
MRMMRVPPVPRLWGPGIGAEHLTTGAPGPSEEYKVSRNRGRPPSVHKFKVGRVDLNYGFPASPFVAAGGVGTLIGRRTMNRVSPGWDSTSIVPPNFCVTIR